MRSLSNLKYNQCFYKVWCLSPLYIVAFEPAWNINGGSSGIFWTLLASLNIRGFFFLFGSFLVFLLLFFLLRYLLWLSKLSLVRFSWVVVLPFHRSTLLFCFAVICYSLVCLVAVHGSKWVAFSHTCCDHFVLQLVFFGHRWMDG